MQEEVETSKDTVFPECGGKDVKGRRITQKGVGKGPTP
jgi:hypothetical protein